MIQLRGNQKDVNYQLHHPLSKFELPVVVNLKHVFELFGLYTTCFLIQKLLELIRLSSAGQFLRKSQNNKGVQKEWFLDLFVRKFVILHQSFLKTYLSSGLFSDPSGSHFEELKSNFEEFDLSQLGDFLTLLALNRWGHDTNTCQMTLAARRNDLGMVLSDFAHLFWDFQVFILRHILHRSIHYESPNMTVCLLAWPEYLGLASQDRQGWGLLTGSSQIKLDLI